MKKIAVLAANMYDWSHGTLYTQCFHPLTAAQAVEENLLWLDGPPVPGVEVAAIWSPDPQRSKKLAKLFGIADVLDHPEEAVGGVDGVICSDDGFPPGDVFAEDSGMMRGADWAEPYILAGTPVFLDKPLARTASQAEKVLNLAIQNHTLLYCASGIAHTMLVDEMLRDAGRLGPLKSVFASGPLGALIFYGQHIYEPVWRVFGGGVKWVQNLGWERHHVLHLGYEDGRSVVLKCLGDAAYQFDFILYGEQEVKHYCLPADAWDFKVQLNHKRVAQKFAHMLDTGEMPYTYAEMHEINKVLTYGQASLDQDGRRIYLDEPAPN